ncbi:MAG: 3-keto-5-aminohexanoate cleavage protein, partial [Alphaproteobacteria bacterium]|nr:3-keto-5-aminohexanoate cleavage protein [Alphaproteobacteria bacterium]
MSNSLQDVILCVAPNGARKTRDDHAAIPISPAELASEAKACMDAGAAMIHLHVRDEAGRHTIAPEFYRPAIAAVREATDEDFIIQITTEAVGIYSNDQQIA